VNSQPANNGSQGASCISQDLLDAIVAEFARARIQGMHIVNYAGANMANIHAHDIAKKLGFDGGRLGIAPFPGLPGVTSIGMTQSQSQPEAPKAEPPKTETPKAAGTLGKVLLGSALTLGTLGLGGLGAWAVSTFLSSPPATQPPTTQPSTGDVINKTGKQVEIHRQGMVEDGKLVLRYRWRHPPDGEWSGWKVYDPKQPITVP